MMSRTMIQQLCIIILTTAAICLASPEVEAACTGQFSPGQVCANNTGALAIPGPTSNLVLGKSGTTGSLDMVGATSGSVHVVPQTVAGTPTITWPTVAGTIVTNAASPMSINTTTGAVSCPTCLTGAGGPLTATNPLSVTGNNLALAYDSNFTNNGSNQLAFSSIASGNLLANSTAGAAEPTSTTVTALIDRAIGSTQGMVLYRGAATWSALGPCSSNELVAWSASIPNPTCTNIQGLNGNYRVVTVAGDVTISSAVTDYMIIVEKTVPAATNVNFPSIAARIAAGGAPVFVKNAQSNPALYPLQPVLNGTDTMEGTATPLPQDSRAGVWYWPDDSVTPNNWETR